MIADARSRMSPIALLNSVVTGVITLEGAIRRTGCDLHSVKRGVDLYVAGTLALVLSAHLGPKLVRRGRRGTRCGGDRHRGDPGRQNWCDVVDSDPHNYLP
jgi:hypothetical protein